MMRLLTN